MAEPAQPELSNHVVILGWDDFNRGIIEQLLAAENEVAVAVNDPDDRDDILHAFPPGSLHVAVGRFDDLSSFESLHLAGCRKVFVNLGRDHDSLIAILKIQSAHPNVEIDVALQNEELRATFYVAGVTYAVSPHAIASKVVASYIYEEDVGEFTTEILRATQRKDDCEFQQYHVLPDHPYAGEPYDEVFWDLRERFGVALLGLSKVDEDGERTLHKLPDADIVVEEGDYLVLIVRGDHEDALVEMFGVDEGIARQFD